MDTVTKRIEVVVNVSVANLLFLSKNLYDYVYVKKTG